MTEWPFNDWLKTAVSLGLTPSEFWRLSLPDWQALTGTAGQPMGRDAFADLTKKYPDEKHD